MRPYKTFKEKWLWKRIDYDKSYGYQCVDLIKQYADEVLGLGKIWAIGNANRVTIGDIVEVNFADNAHNSDFSLAVKARVNRAEAENNGILYAGKILERDNKLLAYLCFKGMDEKLDR